MDERVCWLRVGDARLLVEIRENGTARVNVERGAYEEVDGDTKLD